MSDDIVTRLRMPVQHTLVFGNIEQANDERHEAADEIERLRLDRQRWRKIAELAREAWNTDSWIVFNDEYLRMVRGE